MIDIVDTFNSSAVINDVDIYGFKDEYILIPLNADKEWFESEDGKAAMEDILESEVRILMVLTPFNEFVFTLWEYLYDKGYRKGDFLFIAAA